MLQSLKPSIFPLERWADADKRKANAERTQSERCVNAEWSLVNDLWTMNSERTQNANLAQTRAQDEGQRFKNSRRGKVSERGKLC